ncbi:MAG: hypothetical protein HY901_27405 [Deltaproteobacteria bacterium]|nr:hypothetical protein [Deltaproteobacteria bacterium]
MRTLSPSGVDGPTPPGSPSARHGAPALAFTLLLLGAGCTDPWPLVTNVDGLRLLAIRAEPPDLAPGQSTQLDALVVDPREPGRTNTVLWFACDPDPSQLDQTPCADYTTLQDTSGGEIGADPQTLPEGVRFLGATSPAAAAPVTYLSRADLFAQLTPDDPRRARGVLAVVLALAIAAPPPTSLTELGALLEKVKTKEVESLLGIKRIRISETTTPNHNPRLQGVKVGERLWSPGLRPAKVHPGVSVPLVGVAQPGTVETFEELDADGHLVEKQEKLFVSWFSTVGELRFPRNLEGEDGDQRQELSTPFVLQHVPEDRRATLWAVLRDGRGGVETMVRGLLLCDPFLAPPTLTSLEPASGPPGTLVKVRGEGMESVLDVALGDGWLAAGKWDATAGAFVGSVPSDTPPGPAQVVARGLGCDADPVASFLVTAP